jgi:hypothetical protein
MSPSQLHALRSLLSVILGGIETDNPELSKQAIRRMEKVLDSCTLYPNQEPESETGQTGKARDSFPCR